jgi:HK97 family phage major capsid protein
MGGRCVMGGAAMISARLTRRAGRVICARQTAAKWTSNHIAGARAMTELKEISGMVRQIGENFAETKTALEKRVGQLEAAARRPFFGAADAKASTDPILEGWIRKGDVSGLEGKAMSISADGQDVVVRGDWSDRIFRLIRETSPIRQVANVMKTTSNSLDVLVDRGEPTSAWVAETGTRSATDTSFMSRHPISVFEHYAYPAVTTHLLEDSAFNVEEWLMGKIAARFARQENASFFKGTGSGEPLGILDYGTTPDADFTWGADPTAYTIGAQYTGVDGTLGASNQIDRIGDVVDSLKAEYLPGAVWMMPRSVRNLVRQLKDGEGRFYFQPSLSEGVPDRLMGYPVIIAEDMDAPAADTVEMLFGNFGEAYTIVDRMGMQVIRDPYTTPGNVKFYTAKRVGGALTNPEAVKALVLGVEPV